MISRNLMFCKDIPVFFHFVFIKLLWFAAGYMSFSWRFVMGLSRADCESVKKGWATPFLSF